MLSVKPRATSVGPDASGRWNVHSSDVHAVLHIVGMKCLLATPSLSLKP